MGIWKEEKTKKEKGPDALQVLGQEGNEWRTRGETMDGLTTPYCGVTWLEPDSETGRKGENYLLDILLFLLARLISTITIIIILLSTDIEYWQLCACHRWSDFDIPSPKERHQKDQLLTVSPAIFGIIMQLKYSFSPQSNNEHWTHISLSFSLSIECNNTIDTYLPISFYPDSWVTTLRHSYLIPWFQGVFGIIIIISSMSNKHFTYLVLVRSHFPFSQSRLVSHHSSNLKLPNPTHGPA